MRQFNPDDEVEVQNFGNSESARQTDDNSQCPLLGGAVHTQWGAVSAGHLIAGIAAGTQPQQVPISELAKGTTNFNEFSNIQQTVSPIYPATLSGKKYLDVIGRLRRSFA